MKIEISKLTHDDLEGIYEVEKDSFPIPWPISSFEEELKNILATYLVAKVENKIVSLYNDLSDTGSCWTGWICDVDDNHVLLAHISENGFYGGFTLIELDSIFNIEADTKYEQKIHKLYLLKKQKQVMQPMRRFWKS